MAAISIGSLTDLEKTSYVREGLKFAEMNMVYRQFGQKDDVPAREGKIRQWFRMAVPAVSSAADFSSGSTTYVKNTTGVAPTFSPMTPTDTTVTAQADYLFGRGYEWNNAVAYTSFADIKSELRRISAEHAGRAVDTEARDVLVAGTTVNYANAKASRNLLTAADQIDLYDLFSARTTLQNNQARQIKGLFTVVHSHNASEQLFRDSVLQSAMQFQKDYMFTGTLAEVYGLRFVASDLAPTVTNSGSNNAVGNVEQTLIFGDGAYGVTSWAKSDYDLIYTGPGGWGDEYKTRNALTWTFSGKTVILNQSWMVRLESAR